MFTLGAHFGDVEWDLAIITKVVRVVENKTVVISSVVSSLSECVDNIGRVFEQEANALRKEEEEG